MYRSCFVMKFYPSHQETRLVSYDRNGLIERFHASIKSIKDKQEKEDREKFLFNGQWTDQEFFISIILKISNNFVPIIHGKYMDSDEGTLIQISYNFFPATKKLLMFWTILTLLITLFFIVLYQAWLYGAISFGFCLVNYILSVENFKMQVRKSKRMLDKMLS